MTHCTCTDAQRTPASESPAPTLTSLAIRAADEACNLQDVQHAYAALELLLAPVGLEEAAEIHVTRAELSSLIHLINEELERRVGAVNNAIQSVLNAIDDEEDAD
jgi:hypothetical protein